MTRYKFYEWHRFLKKDPESIEVDERIERLSTLRDTENVALMSGSVRKDRRQTLAKISEAIHFLKTSFEGIHLS
ncbi:hypothetical protein TNCV_1483541 [Trichonephila clavipes]|nr:hypothetical protein TNCV_1483541 [Trichonephila clavipes]